MEELYSQKAVFDVMRFKQSYCKFLSANDSGETGGHQSGVLIAKSAVSILFDKPIFDEKIAKRTVHIRWQDDFETESTFTWYSSKSELRITRFGRGFPFLKPDETGALFVFIREDVDDYQAYILQTDEEINDFFDTLGISPTNANKMIEIDHKDEQIRENEIFEKYISQFNEEFPSTKKMSKTARIIENDLYDHKKYMITNPDKKIISWTNVEYQLFKNLENVRYGNKIKKGFDSVEDFVQIANKVLNRRKSRAGKSLENHLEALFTANELEFESQCVTEGKKKPDFLFPSKKDYDNLAFPADHLVTLAAKTTCKDRWRQVINEADRISVKYLCTLQQGVSVAQMNEMEKENVVLVVPKPYFLQFSEEVRGKLLSIKQFIKMIKEKENG